MKVDIEKDLEEENIRALALQQEIDWFLKVLEVEMQISVSENRYVRLFYYFKPKIIFVSIV